MKRLLAVTASAVLCILALQPSVSTAEIGMTLSAFHGGRYVPGAFAQASPIAVAFVGQGQAGWFSFDMSEPAGDRVCGVTFTFTQDWTTNPQYFPLTMAIYDVSTPYDRLSIDRIPMDAEGEMIAIDLHTGNVYGTFLASTEDGRLYEIELSDFALADLQALIDAQEPYFSVGLANESFDAPGYFEVKHVTLRVTMDCVVEVAIDIKPGSYPNSINPESKGVIPVAVLTTSRADGDAVDFDAWDLDPSTLTFGPLGAGIAHATGHAEDVDGDGDLDMVLHFRTRMTGLACGDSEATLNGRTHDGLEVEGRDVIETPGC